MFKRNILFVLIAVVLFIGLILIEGYYKKPKIVDIMVNYSVGEDCAHQNIGTSCMEYILFTYKGIEYKVNIGKYGYRSDFACNRYSSYYVDVPNCSCLYEAKILNIKDKILTLTDEARTKACEALLEERAGKDWWEKCYEKCKEPTLKSSKNFTKKYPDKVEIIGIYHPYGLFNYSIVAWPCMPGWPCCRDEWPCNKTKHELLESLQLTLSKD